MTPQIEGIVIAVLTGLIFWSASKLYNYFVDSPEAKTKEILERLTKIENRIDQIEKDLSVITAEYQKLQNETKQFVSRSSFQNGLSPVKQEVAEVERNLKELAQQKLDIAKLQNSFQSWQESSGEQHKMNKEWIEKLERKQDLLQRHLAEDMDKIEARMENALKTLSEDIKTIRTESAQQNARIIDLLTNNQTRR